jgi:hypothetical protein
MRPKSELKEPNEPRRAFKRQNQRPPKGQTNCTPKTQFLTSLPRQNDVAPEGQDEMASSGKCQHANVTASHMRHYGMSPIVLIVSISHVASQCIVNVQLQCSLLTYSGFLVNRQSLAMMSPSSRRTVPTLMSLSSCRTVSPASYGEP